MRDTRAHVRLELAGTQEQTATISFWEVFTLTSFRDRNLFAASQAGLVNNLNDGMSWGIFPLFFTSFGLGVERIGILKAVYPTTWGILQLVTGPLSDRWGRKGLIVAGMWVQAAALFLTAATRRLLALARGQSAARDRHCHGVSELDRGSVGCLSPAWRARSLSVYRFWRDLGYAVGALTAGVIADLFGFASAITSVATLTFLSGLVVAVVMREPKAK